MERHDIERNEIRLSELNDFVPPLRRNFTQRLWGGAPQQALNTGLLGGRTGSFGIGRQQTPDSSLSEDREAEESFFSVVLDEQKFSYARSSQNFDDDIRKKSYINAREWYSRFLKKKFTRCWGDLLCPALQGLEFQDPAEEPRFGELAIVFKFLRIVAVEIKTKHEITLPNIVDAVRDAKLLKLEENDRNNEAFAKFLVFVAIGWLTASYQPSMRFTPDMLEIVKPAHTSSRTHTLRRRTFKSFRQKMSYTEEPLYQFLRRFGQLIPNESISPGTHSTGGQEPIAVSCLCFDILYHIADIKIEWVNELSLHLEFDSVRKSLKIFRFPSLCRLMYHEASSTIMSRLFADFNNLMSDDIPEELPEDSSAEYFREVLLSYRLIFGQDKHSSRLFARQVTKMPVNWNNSDSSSDDNDPMLLILCTQHWKSAGAKEIYEDIEAADTSHHYQPADDFPFLGRKLLELQAYVKGRDAHSWKALWYDKRDMSMWWTFWLVIYIGVPSVLFSLVQCIFQILSTFK